MGCGDASPGTTDGGRSCATPIQFIRGVGPQRANLLGNLGITTVEDALFAMPFRYEDRRTLAPIADILTGQEVTVLGAITRSEITTTPRQHRKLFRIHVSDGTGELCATWFNQAYLKDILVEGKTVLLSGKASFSRYAHCLELLHPVFEMAGTCDTMVHAGRIVPMYHLTKGITQKFMRRMLYHLVNEYAAALPDLVPAEILTRRGFVNLAEAIREVHFPTGDDLDAYNRGATPFHQRIAYEEMFLLQLMLALRRRWLKQQAKGCGMRISTELLNAFLELLPFELTEAQRRVLREISLDIQSGRPMHRLLQGEVGCGKTIVALIAMIIALGNGFQAALMAPTEILAEQHLFNIRALLAPLSITPVLLISGMKAAARRQALEAIQSGEARLVIGTHALIQQSVEFNNLGMIIVDEQHRFGVLHRVALKQKGLQPHVLVMTATPIPRSLSLTVFGHLDVSVIDEMPAGRLPVTTMVLDEDRRGWAYDHIRREAREGRQVFIVFPLVEESERVDLKDACGMHERLSATIFSEFRVGLLHGRMKSEEKEAVMREFAAGTISILVSTTVVEVGIDVRNATVMMVEHAERFGLAQLHQMRGRVGRGEAPSWCLLMAGEQISGIARHRLEILAQSNDGFRVAEEDLILRGPGELLGTKQSGPADLKLLNLIRHPRLIEEARQDAEALVTSLRESGRNLSGELRAALRRRWHGRLDLLGSG